MGNLLDDDDDTFDNAANPAATAGGDDDFDEFEEPQLPIGVFPGHIRDAKLNPNNSSQVILEIKSEDPTHEGCEPAAAFFKMTDRRDFNRLMAIAGALGVPVERNGRTTKIMGGLSALKNKSGVFIVDTWTGKDGSINASLSRGMPGHQKNGKWKSAEFGEWISKNPLSPEQINAIKVCPGVILPQHKDLF